MKISARGQYALAAMMEIAQRTKAGEIVPVASIADTLGISKLFLEQTMALIKKSDMLHSTKGAKGGYELARDADTITVYEILGFVETTLIEKMDTTVLDKTPTVESTLTDKVFTPLNDIIEDCLTKITLQDLLDYYDDQSDTDSFMIYM